MRPKIKADADLFQVSNTRFRGGIVAATQSQKYMYDARLCSYIPPLLLPLQSATPPKKQTSARFPDTIREEDMPEPNNSELQPNPILQNFRLIFSWPLLFAFTLGPVLGLLTTCFMAIHFDKIRTLPIIAYLPARAQMLIFLIPCLAAVALAGWLSDKVKTRLKEEGYIEVRTRAREIDFGINMAVCGAWLFWFRNWDKEGETVGWVDFCTKIGLMVVGMDVLLFQMMLGSTVWYTAKAR